MASSTNGHVFLPRVLPPLLVLVTAGFLVVAVNADAVVTGTVYCDQCKDGFLTFFDYPLSGARVAVACPDQYREERTNFLGTYSIRFEGGTDLTACYARVLNGTGDCAAATGPPQPLKFYFWFFGTEAYSVDPLLAQPIQPVGFCPKAAPPTEPLPTPTVGFVPPPAGLIRPPWPSSPPRLPIIPSLEDSACSYDKWLMPQFRCYWRVVAPETAVAIAFGPVAASKYGPEMTLWDALHGRGDLYRTLLREATAALLNSYNSWRFIYPALSVVSNMNLALLGNQREALMTALRFRRANSGISGRSSVACNFTSCP